MDCGWGSGKDEEKTNQFVRKVREGEFTKAADIAPMKDCIGGAVVGSHFMKLMREHDFAPEAVSAYCSSFKREMEEL